MKVAGLVLLFAFETLNLSAAAPKAAAIVITPLSARADRVSGGDVLVRIVAPERGLALRARM